MVIGEAFFDESGTNDDDKNLCLGGYVFVGNAAATFEVEWRAMLAAYGLQRFHMREFRQQNKGVFKHLTAEQREYALLDAIKIIQTYASCGMAFSIDKADLGAITKGSDWSKSYSFLANQTFYGIERLLGGEEPGEVNYVFEHGAEGWGEAEKVFKDAKSEPALAAQFRLGEFHRKIKDEAVQLQAADLLVWSTLRDRRRVDDGGKVGQHDEFKRLQGVRLEVHHWNNEAGEFIQWILRAGVDEDFLEWLRHVSNRQFLSWLKAAGPDALRYFVKLFKERP